MKIKSFKIFESNSITNIEVKNIVDDILVDLSDLSDSFSWTCYTSLVVNEMDTEKTFKNCHLIIKCFTPQTPDNKKESLFDKAASLYDKIAKTKNSEWVDILERLFYLLNEEGIKVFDQKESFTEVKPGKINLEWSLQARRNPMNFQVESVWWEKDFFLKK